MKRYFKILSFVIIAFCLWRPALFSQISPGDLAQVHAHLEGMSNCTKCHLLGEKVSDEKCLDCHTEIKVRIDNNKGYHVSSEVKGNSCVNCHNDHHGRNFEIIRLDKSKFDHSLTGYGLTGAHKKKACDDCHKKQFIQDENIRKKSYTFLGLGTSCISCHEDYHQGTLASQCNNCHGNEKFLPASLFNHQKAAFQLVGKHEQVDCAKCHKKTTLNGKLFQQFKNIAFKNCTDCHEDIHKGKFGNDCRQCHTEQSFLTIKDQNRFDHNQTGYKLEGKHVNLDCKKCHKEKYSAPLPHKKCTDCHKDFHKGQFMQQGEMRDCAECHTVEGFAPSNFTINQHKQSAFPLEGAHLATPCFECHKKTGQWSFRNIGSKCIDCHNDIHDSKINPKYYPEKACKNCHSINSWDQIRFNHSVTGYDLLGKHKNQGCRDCHFRNAENNQKDQSFTGLGKSCVNCHKDNHFAQFEIDGKTDCERCHDFENWKAAKFNHNTAAFKLDGAHEKVACNKCHKQIKVDDKVFVQYKFEDFRCETCHH